MGEAKRRALNRAARGEAAPQGKYHTHTIRWNQAGEDAFQQMLAVENDARRERHKPLLTAEDFFARTIVVAGMTACEQMQQEFLKQDKLVQLAPTMPTARPPLPPPGADRRVVVG